MKASASSDCSSGGSTATMSSTTASLMASSRSCRSPRQLYGAQQRASWLLARLESKVHRICAPHQQEQVGIEIDEDEIPDRVPEEDNREDAGPYHDLNPLQLRSIAIAGQIAEK